MSLKIILVLMIVCVAGCRTVSPSKNTASSQNGESAQDAQTAVQSVVGAMSGQDIDEQRLKDFAREIHEDQDTQTAVQAVTDAMSGQKAVVKYCPVDGKRFSEHFISCPEHHQLLKIVE